MKVCSVEGCEGKRYCRGFCTAHYQRFQRHGDASIIIRPKRQHGLDGEALKTHIFSRCRKNENGCLIWEGSRHTQGYGLIGFKGKNASVHRLVFALEHGRSLDSLQHICHTCDEPPCANPAHLFEGTHQDNMADKVAKGRCSHMKGEQNAQAKLTAQDVLDIRSSTLSQTQLARQYSVTQTNISDIKRHRTWAHI